MQRPFKERQAVRTHDSYNRSGPHWISEKKLTDKPFLVTEEKETNIFKEIKQRTNGASNSVYPVISCVVKPCHTVLRWIFPSVTGCCRLRLSAKVFAVQMHIHRGKFILGKKTVY